MIYNTLKKILTYTKPYRLTLITAIAMAIVNVFMVLIIPILIGNSIDYIIDVGNVNFEIILNIIVKIVVVAILASTSQFIMSSCINSVTYRTTQDIRNATINKIHTLPFNYIDTNPSGNIISIIINDIDSIADGLQQSFTQFFIGINTIIGTLLFMFSINVIVGLVVVILTPISVVVATLISRYSYKSFRKQLNLQGELSSHIEEMISNQKIIKAFNQEDESINRFKEINNRLYDSGIKAQFFSSLSNPSTRFVNVIVYTAVGIVGAALLILKGNITIGDISCFLAYANQYTRPFNEITGILTQIQTAFAGANRVFKLLDEENETPDLPTSIELTDCKGKISLEHVYFSYTSSVKLIEDFNLEVNPGQRIAIVGPTGSGKTTLINLLMRFYDVTKGSIKIDDIPINNIKKDSLRNLFGMVLQDTWLFSGTVADNISYADMNISREKIENAAQMAYAHNFIKKLNNGYDTIISENGDNLSHGERQLISIARVMLKNPPMLILDEATSNIDTITELKIQKAFKAMMKGRTSFIVAHRLSTIKEADLILVMNNGNIIEQGNHDELISRNGFYSNLYKSQFCVE